MNKIIDIKKEEKSKNSFTIHIPQQKLLHI